MLTRVHVQPVTFGLMVLYFLLLDVLFL